MAHNNRNLTGQRYGELIVLAEAGRTNAQKIKWLCRCDCGKEFVAVGASLVSGHTTTCGCARLSRPRNFKHGHSHTNGRRQVTRAYRIWANMKSRCNNPNLPEFVNYGGRGITYDPRWDAFENFLADMGEPPEGRSLDRIDNNKGYSKANCRWATQMQQNRNSRRNVLIEFCGQVKPLSEWAAIYRIRYGLLYKRIVLDGWTPEKAFTTDHYDTHGRIKT